MPHEFIDSLVASYAALREIAVIVVSNQKSVLAALHTIGTMKFTSTAEE
jgi:hypothetical protein